MLRLFRNRRVRRNLAREIQLGRVQAVYITRRLARNRVVGRCVR